MSDFAVLKRLLALARPWRAWILCAVLVASATVLAGVALMTIAGWFIGAMAIAGISTGIMNYFLPSAGIRLFAIVRTGGRYGERLLSHEATFRLLASLRLWLFRRLEPLAPAQLEQQRGADLAATLQADIDTLQHAYLRLASPLMVALSCSVLVVTGLAILHPPTAIAVGILLLAAGGISPAIAKRVADAPGAEAVRSRAALRVAVVDLLQGLSDLRTTGAVGRQLATIGEWNNRLVDAQCRAATSGALSMEVVSFCASLALWSTALLAGASASQGGLPPALIPALALAALAVFEAIGPLPAAIERWSEVTAAGRRLIALADQTPIFGTDLQPSPAPVDGSVVFSAVCLRYAHGAKPALDSLDLAIQSGQRIALLGPSGAGKSSIAGLLLRFWDYEGEIRLGGHNLRRYRPEDLRRLVGVAAQDAQLFNGTVRDNLLMAEPRANDFAMYDALETAQLAGFVRALPDGLDTWIGEAGARLSAGQARRLVLARTLLRKPLVLVLDEPTENLDASTSRRLLEDLVVAVAGRTAILITHDPRAAVTFAQDVVRMDAGRTCR